MRNIIDYLWSRHPYNELAEDDLASEDIEVAGPVVIEGIDLGVLEEAATERVERFLPYVESVMDHDPMCEACRGVVIRHTIIAVLANLGSKTPRAEPMKAKLQRWWCRATHALDLHPDLGEYWCVKCRCVR